MLSLTRFQIVEDSITRLPNWPWPNNSRREWQDGSLTWQYVATSKIFKSIHQGAMKTRPTPEADYPIHPWIDAATSRYKALVANPWRTRYYQLVDGSITPLRRSENTQIHKALQSGDIVWFSFGLHVRLNDRGWVSEMVPYELIKVTPSHSVWSDESVSNQPEEPKVEAPSIPAFALTASILSSFKVNGTFDRLQISFEILTF